MRVLMLDQAGQLGGAEFAMLELCQRAGFDWSAVLFSDGPFRSKLEETGKKVEVVSLKDVNDLRKDGGVRSIFRAIRGAMSLVMQVAEKAKSYDVIYANTQKAMVVGALAGLLTRRPVVWYLHDIMSRAHFGRVQLQIVRFMARYLLNAIICNSEASRAELCALTGKQESDFPVVYNGIPSEPFDAIEAEERQALRKQFGLPENAFLVGCFSRLAFWKGQHILLEAIAKDESAHAVLVGGPLFNAHAYEADLHRKVVELGIADRVHFLGFQYDIPRLMRAVDLVVHTSVEPEPFGRVIVEGMLAQRPVIVSLAGGVPEIVEHMKSGIQVKRGDDESLFRAIELLRNDPELATRIARTGYLRARARFTPGEHCKKMSRVLEGYDRDSAGNRTSVWLPNQARQSEESGAFEGIEGR